MPNTIIDRKNGVTAFVEAIHKGSPLTVASMVYLEMIQVMSKKRNANESFHNLWSRFSAQVSQFHALVSNTALPDAMSAQMLLFSANADFGRRVSILAVASPAPDSVEDSSTTDS